ncbi:MAG: SNF2-related protein, partial [Candidatus Methanosuratincola petrocarbonis]
MPFKDLGMNNLEFEGRGERIAKEFYIPVLRESISYDRATGYFSVDALVHAASGVAGLINNGGKMRLILGAHDVPEELWEAYKMGMISGREVVEEIGKRIAEGLEKVEDIFVKRRLEVLAWMFNKGLLEVKVVLPRHLYMGQTGIFHIKTMIFRDKDGSIIAAEGSANETEPAYTVNGERIVVFYSWRPEDKERVENTINQFEKIWNAEHSDYDVFNLPEAVYRTVAKLTPKHLDAPPEPGNQRGDARLDRLLPVCRMVRILPRVRCLAHMGLGPVRLFPHQARAVDLAMERYPFRILFADEVGLGKTIEAGACVKLLWSLGYVRRALILAPKNVTRQWWEELRLKFGLPAYLLKPGKPCAMVAPDGKEIPVQENPFNFADLIVASWHYVRGRRGSEPEIFKAKPFDLVLIDEAHAARITRSEFTSPRPTRLHELATALSSMTPHVFLLTATPLQLNPLEILDLMKILGLGGAWVHEDSFMKCYEILKKDPEGRDEGDWNALFSLVSWFSRTYLDRNHREAVVKSFFQGELADEILSALEKTDGDAFRRIVRRLDASSRASLDGTLRGLMPTSWFIVRNTRERLKREGYRFPERLVENVDVALGENHSALLEGLEVYLQEYYNDYKKFLTGNERAGYGLISSVYYQRFVSSFASAYCTVKRRKEFLESLLEGDEERMFSLASELLEGSEEDLDEDELIESAKESIEKARPLIEQEIKELNRLGVELSRYKYASSASDDPKLREIRRVVEQLRSEGRKVLVFSKFTDTVEIVRDFLSQRFGEDRVGTYTGKGGE